MKSRKNDTKRQDEYTTSHCSMNVREDQPKYKIENGLINQKSEEVQAIIDRMPTYWTKWIALCVFVLMGVVVLLGFVIQYPDTVDGQISVTANIATHNP